LQLLISASADANAKGGKYGCPLGASATWGNKNLLLLLLNAGADVNTKGGY
jgi:hypothetical protein